MVPQEPRIRAHFLGPLPPGRPPGWLPDEPGVGQALGRAENRVCGDVVELFLVVLGDRLERVGYEATGCGSVRATASLACEELAGTDLAAAAALDVAELVRASGGLPPSKAHAPRVVQRALAAALADHRSRCHP